jgi:hypothetical protein
MKTKEQDKINFAITVKERVLDIYSKPFNGHPSREDDAKNEEAILFLAEQIDSLYIKLIRKV